MIHYQNPKLVVGTLPVFENKILLCKRAIEPGRGLWTLPGGFMENGEDVRSGAIRETIEEANAEIELERLLSVFSIPAINHVHLIFLATLKHTRFSPGAESLETRLFESGEIPWDSIAFETIRFALRGYLADLEQNQATVHIGSYPPLPL